MPASGNNRLPFFAARLAHIWNYHIEAPCFFELYEYGLAEFALRILSIRYVIPHHSVDAINGYYVWPFMIPFYLTEWREI